MRKIQAVNERQLTRIILEWLRENYPNLRRQFGYYHFPDLDDVTLWSYNIMYVWDDKVQINNRKAMYHPADPEFFKKLKPQVSRTINRMAKAHEGRISLV